MICSHLFETLNYSLVVFVLLFITFVCCCPTLLSAFVRDAARGCFVGVCVRWCCYYTRDIIKRKREKTTLETQNGALGQRPILDGDDETLPTQSTQRLGLDDHEILALLKQTEEERTCFIQGRGEGKKVLPGEMFGREEENQHPSVLAESGEVRERVHVGAKSEHGRFEGNGEEEKEEN